MQTADLVYALAMATLAAFVVWGVWQYFRVKKAQRNNEHSALADLGPLDSSHEPMERDPAHRS